MGLKPVIRSTVSRILISKGSHIASFTDPSTIPIGTTLWRWMNSEVKRRRTSGSGLHSFKLKKGTFSFFSSIFPTSWLEIRFIAIKVWPRRCPVSKCFLSANPSCSSVIKPAFKRTCPKGSVRFLTVFDLTSGSKIWTASSSFLMGEERRSCR